jgi:hypothetical protein
MRRLAVAVLFALTSWAAVAQEGPPTERLAESVKATIPSFWSLGDLRVVATANLGDAVEPRIKQRLEADVAPIADLFVVDGAAQASLAPFTPLLPTVAAGTKRTLHGIANSTYAAGVWTVELRLENAVAGLGQPVDLFGSPTVVRGSEEEARLRERLRTDMIDRLRAQLASEREQVEAQLRDATSRFQAQQEAELARLVDGALATLGRARDEVERLRSSFAEEIATATRGREAVLESLKQEHEARRLAVVQEQQAALDRLKAEHEAELKRVEAEYAQEIARAEAEIKGRAQLVEAERRKQEELVRLTEALMATAERDRAAAEERRRAEETVSLQAKAAAEQAQRAQQEALEKVAQEKAQRIERVLSTMQGKDRAAALAAFETAISGDDQAMRDAALSAALSSDHPGVRHRALRWSFANAGTMSGQLSGKYSSEEFSGTYSLVIQDREEKQGLINFTGDLRSPLFGRTGCSPVKGTVNGDVISASGGICSLTLKLSKAQMLEGSLHHEKVDTPTMGCCPAINMRATASLR